MRPEVTFRTLIALLLASFLIAATLPAGAAVPAAVDDGPALVDASHDEHGERCCLPELGGHKLCHVVAALLDRNVTGTAALPTTRVLPARSLLVTRSLPPIQKPPIVAT